jgi:aspartyl-tRNA(Asn)/glutamyl-tRNA(Gln) amidotransferase subunit C
MDKEKVLNLANLARINLDEAEAEKLASEFGAILKYVSEVQSVKIAEEDADNRSALKNVFREDLNPHEPGLYTEAILNQAPKREGNYLKVKKIL